MKKTRKTLTVFLIVSTVLIAAAGAYLKHIVFAEIGMFQDDFIITVPFQFLADDSAQYALQNAVIQDVPRDDEENPRHSAQTEPDVEIPQETQNTTPEIEATTPDATLPTEPQPLEIDESWFDDVLFIGDSRTVGLRDIARLGEADYFCDLSMTVFKVMNYTVYDKGFGKEKLSGALEENKYGKIFIHLGLNECATRKELVIQKFQELIDLIQEKQPEAKIVLQSIMTVSESKAKDPKFSMENITALNQELERLAQENDLIYLDTNEWAADEEGFLREDIRMDGAHPTGTGYREWAQWLVEKAAYFGIP